MKKISQPTCSLPSLPTPGRGERGAGLFPPPFSSSVHRYHSTIQPLQPNTPRLCAHCDALRPLRKLITNGKARQSSRLLPTFRYVICQQVSCVLLLKKIHRPELCSHETSASCLQGPQQHTNEPAVEKPAPAPPGKSSNPLPATQSKIVATLLLPELLVRRCAKQIPCACPEATSAHATPRGAHPATRSPEEIAELQSSVVAPKHCVEARHPSSPMENPRRSQGSTPEIGPAMKVPEHKCLALPCVPVVVAAARSRAACNSIKHQVIIPSRK